MMICAGMEPICFFKNLYTRGEFADLQICRFADEEMEASIHFYRNKRCWKSWKMAAQFSSFRIIKLNITKCIVSNQPNAL